MGVWEVALLHVIIALSRCSWKNWR